MLQFFIFHSQTSTDVTSSHAFCNQLRSRITNVSLRSFTRFQNKRSEPGGWRSLTTRGGGPRTAFWPSGAASINKHRTFLEAALTQHKPSRWRIIKTLQHCCYCDVQQVGGGSHWHEASLVGEARWEGNTTNERHSFNIHFLKLHKITPTHKDASDKTEQVCKSIFIFSSAAFSPRGCQVIDRKRGAP